MIPKRLSKPKRFDRISNLPSNIIETILCLVPMEDTVRTSVLSKDWRYKWTKIPKLVFIELLPLVRRYARPEPLNERKQFTRKGKLFYAIHQVLLLHDAPIFEFTLSMDNANMTCVEIDQIITHLSRHNTLTKFELQLPYWFYSRYGDMYRLPISIFSWHQLTHLSLDGCSLKFEPTFSGLGNLTTLYLSVPTFKKTLLHLLSGSPLLKSFTLTSTYYEIYGNDVTIIDIFNCLPVIERLTLNTLCIECFVQKGLPRELPTALVHLKYLCIEYLKLTDEFQLFFLGLLIRSAPNLEKIKIADIRGNGSDENSVTLEEVSDICLEHLIELEINDFKEYQLELEFVKLILAKSPMLKKVKIFYGSWITNEKELEMCKILLRSPRASPKAEIIVERIVEIPYDCIWL